MELNIHQQILSDIASNIGETEQDLQYATNVITSKVQTRDVPHVNGVPEETKGRINGANQSDVRVYMPASRVHCNIAFGELVVNFPDAHISSSTDTLLPVLADVLQDVPYIDFDQCLSWEDWALPDQLVFSTVTALLRISSSHPELSGSAIEAISNFIIDVHNMIAEDSTSECQILTQLVPALHGLYRAISSTSFPWTIAQWNTLTTQLSFLCSPEQVEKLNNVLISVPDLAETDPETHVFIDAFLARYISRGRPLSGYFLVCCIIETEWTILAQTLTPLQVTGFSFSKITEAAAANKAWNYLMRNAAEEVDFAEATEVANTLKGTVKYAMQCFTDLLVQIEDMDGEPGLDTYASETMSECLVCRPLG